jgi:hypothetical protein
LDIDFIVCFTCVVLWVGVNNQDYAKVDKSKGEDFCSSTDCYGKATQKRLKESTTNPNVVVTITNKKVF